MRTVIALCLLGLACAAPPSEDADLQGGLENGSFTANLNGFDIHYEVHGSGPVLMTVPNSWGLTLEGLRGLYRPLEDHLTMVYFDPRGMGGSSEAREDSDRGVTAIRRDFQALREHLGFESVNAIGWSNGATNLVFIASERPGTIASAVFLHGNATFTQEDARQMASEYRELMEAFGAFEKEMQNEALSDRERQARVKSFDLNVWFPYMCAAPDACRESLSAAFEDAEFSWLHAQQTNREWSSLDARDRLPAISARSLVIAGAHDMLPPSKGEEMAEGIPGARFVLFENSGHFAPLEETERFVEAVTEFLTASP